MNEHEKVKEFHRVCGIATQDRPTTPEEATRVLRCRLLLEEVLEFIKASGCSVQVNIHRQSFSLLTTHAPDLAAMAQENADIRYIAHGNDLAMGVDGRVFDAVHHANMRKAPGGVVTRRADGKVVKPDGWKPPDVARVLEEWEP